MINTTSLITTLIPTYRRPLLLRRAVLSATSQEGVDLRVCVFDNCSGDETAEMILGLSQTQPEIRYHCHTSNIGGVANFDFAMHSVETPFFSILSDDDYLLPGFYQHALAGLKAHPEAMFWAGLTLSIDKEGTIWDGRVDRWSREGLYTPPEGLMRLMHGMVPAWTGILFRKEVLERVGFLDRETLGPSDMDFILRAAASHPFVISKQPCAVYLLNTESYSATQPLSSFWPGWQKIFFNIENNNSLQTSQKVLALQALHKDAKRMLFRRGANALAMSRYDFSREAAQVLSLQYGKKVSAHLLSTLAHIFEKFPWSHRAYVYLYRALERNLIKSRADLALRYGHLIQKTH